MNELLKLWPKISSSMRFKQGKLKEKEKEAFPHALNLKEVSCSHPTDGETELWVSIGGWFTQNPR